jgi:hypothetical protein
MRDNVPAAAKARRASQAGGADTENTGGATGADEGFDLDAELDKVIGLDAVKDMLRSIRNSVQVAQAALPSPSPLTPNPYPYPYPYPYPDPYPYPYPYPDPDPDPDPDPQP